MVSEPNNPDAFSFVPFFSGPKIPENKRAICYAWRNPWSGRPWNWAHFMWVYNFKISVKRYGRKVKEEEKEEGGGEE